MTKELMKALKDTNKEIDKREGYLFQSNNREKFESRADELKNTLAKVNEKINRIVEIDGNAFDEALINEIESIQNLIRKAIFETGGK